MADGQGELKNRNARAIYRTSELFNYFFQKYKRRYIIGGSPFSGGKREIQI